VIQPLLGVVVGRNRGGATGRRVRMGKKRREGKEERRQEEEREEK
jgi:hypothetical protein